MNVRAAVLSDASRESAAAATDAARRINWTNTRAPTNQPSSSKPGTPGPVATSRSRSSGRKPAILAGRFKFRMLNKRETTAVVSANAAMAMKEPRNCQRAAINSSAIQIMVDVANQAVTGWLRTTLEPLPTMMTATASVTRLSQRKWVFVFTLLLPPMKLLGLLSGLVDLLPAPLERDAEESDHNRDQCHRCCAQRHDVQRQPRVDERPAQPGAAGVAEVEGGDIECGSQRRRFAGLIDHAQLQARHRGTGRYAPH